MADPLHPYREHLILAEQRAQEDYDKTILKLSAGALGVSFAFAEHYSFLYDALPWAWGAWGASLFCVLASFFTSRLALRRAISQVDAGTIYGGRVGGPYSRWTQTFNIAAGILFLTGVLVLTIALWK